MKRSTSALRTLTIVTFCAPLVLLAVACGAAAPMHAPSMGALPVAQDVPTAEPAPLTENHFRSDRTHNVTEEDLKRILEAPVTLEEDTRVGIVPVATAYAADPGLPLAEAPSQLSRALERTGLFDVTTEISTDWPTDQSIAGLRELAARYRVKYLLLYRHRFVDREYTNGWGWTWPTLVGVLATPSQTLEAAGVMEASLFDVRTGTILFTVFHRVQGKSDETIYNNEHKMTALKERLLEDGTKALADQMVHKVKRVASSEPARRRQPSVVPPPVKPITPSNGQAGL